MNLEDYTPDAICRAMNLSKFIEEPWTQDDHPTLRLVLTPSFHPELCFTFSRTGNAALLSTVALREQFWSSSDIYQQTDTEKSQQSLSTFEEAVSLFRAGYADFNPDRRYVCLDGMGSESCLVSREGTQQLCAHIAGQTANGRFVARLIDLAWSSCHQPRVRNALAQAASYLRINYPMQNVPPEPPVARMMVLGTPDERHDFLEMLKAEKAKDSGEAK